MIVGNRPIAKLYRDVQTDPQDSHKVRTSLRDQGYAVLERMIDTPEREVKLKQYFKNTEIKTPFILLENETKAYILNADKTALELIERK